MVWCLDKCSVVLSASLHLVVPTLLWSSRCFLHGVAAWRNSSPTGPVKTPHSVGIWHWGYWVVLGPVQWMRALQIQIHSHSSPNIHVRACTHIDLVPVICRPCNVSLLRQVFRFSLALPGALSASSSHSFRYVKKSSDSHYRKTSCMFHDIVHVQCITSTNFKPWV